MVNYSMDAVFAALADPTRRAILARLARGSASVTGLAQPFAISLPAVSKHLKVLERAGLLARRRDGRVHRLALRAAPLREAAGWIARYREFWEERLDALDRYLRETPENEEETAGEARRVKTTKPAGRGRRTKRRNPH